MDKIKSQKNEIKNLVTWLKENRAVPKEVRFCVLKTIIEKHHEINQLNNIAKN